MQVKEFQAESKRLLDLMINSIYTHKEIFLRELISNASDAIDKIYYKALTDEGLDFNQDDYYIKIKMDLEQRLLKVIDTGIGMTEEELEENLGVIAQSGSLAFKTANAAQDGYDIIGQFGVGFYSAFMVAEEVTVISRAFGSEQAFKWTSKGAEGYTIQPWDKGEVGTEVILKIKEKTEEENFDGFLEEYRLRQIVKKYSDFIRYPIKMMVTKSRPKADSEGEYEEYRELETINSMVPIWRKNRNELTAEDYHNFYTEKHYGFDQPLRYIHINAEGLISYRSILYIPSSMPFDYYTKEYEKGLELYANGVLIMDKCADLLPDYFSFVKGMVDSEDFSLNISRELLQHDRQLKVIAKNIQNRIKGELSDLLKNEREDYEKFFDVFGKQLKYGLYSDFGSHKDVLEDLLMFYSSQEQKMVTLAEYVSRMSQDQKYIYYAVGDNIHRIDKLPHTELVKDKGYEILYFTDDVDEFAIKMLGQYQEKEFKSVSSGDLGLDLGEGVEKEVQEDYQELFALMQEHLADKVQEVKASKRLRNHPVCLASTGEISIEMEKILNAMPYNEEKVKADKILELNPDHPMFDALQKAFEQDPEKVKTYTDLLYNQALLIEGLPIEDPVAFTNDIWRIMN